MRKRARPRRDNALMPIRRRHMDLRGLRQDLGASIKEMAAGLGMSVADTAAFIKDEAVLWAGVIRDAKVQGE